MNAWAFGTVVLVVAICVTAWLADRQADRGHEIRWHDRFYQPQLPHRTRRVIDVQTRNTPRPGDRGVKAADLPAPRYQADYVKLTD